MQTVKQLFEKLTSISAKDFYQVEADLFVLLQEIPDDAKSDVAVAFLTISSWKGTSLRSGVWTFYESARKKDLQTTSAYLTSDGQIEFAEVFSRGIHDYQNPVYAENFDYPSEWMDEADEIDHWISAHEHWLDAWMRNLLLKSKDTVIEQFA